MKYLFEVWSNRAGQKVLVCFYEQNGETFAQWTAEADTLPESEEEGRELLEALDWELELTNLRKNGFKQEA